MLLCVYLQENVDIDKLKENSKSRQLVSLSLILCGTKNKQSISELFQKQFFRVSAESSRVNDEKVANNPNSPVDIPAKDLTVKEVLEFRSSEVENCAASSFDFLPDSLVASLLRKFDGSTSLSDTSNGGDTSCSFNRNRSQSFPNLTNMSFAKKINRRESDNDYCFMQSWPSQNSFVKRDCVVFKDSSFDILDVTLPVLQPPKQKRSANCLSPLTSPRMPKLRRCRSLAFENELLANQSELALLFESCFDENTIQEKIVETKTSNYLSLSKARTTNAEALSDVVLSKPSPDDQTFKIPDLKENINLPLVSSTPKHLPKVKDGKYLCSPLLLSGNNSCNSPVYFSDELFMSDALADNSLKAAFLKETSSNEEFFTVLNHSSDMFV